MSSRPFLSLGIVFGLLGLVALVLMNLPMGRAHPDDFYLPRLFMDLYREGGRWRDWIPPSAPSLFPDGLIYGMLALFSMDILWVSNAYAAVIALMTGLVIALFARPLVADPLCAILVAGIALLGLVGFGEDLTTWSRPSQHFLSFFNMVLAGALLLASMRHRSWLGPMVLLAALAVVSDFLFVPLWLGATGGALVAAWLLRVLPLGSALVRVGSAVAAVVLGVIAYRLFIPHPQDNPVWASGMSLRDVATSVAPHRNALLYLGGHLVSTWFLVPLATMVLAWWFNRRDRQNAAMIAVVAAFLVGGILANLYTVGLGFHATTSRTQYHIFVWNGEILMFALAVVLLLQRMRGALPGAFVVLGVVGIVLAARTVPPWERVAGYRDFSAEVECVTALSRQAGLRYGLASFGNSDRFTVVSDGGLYLNTMTGNRLRTKHYVLSSAWNRHRFGFVLVDNEVHDDVYRRKKMHYPISREVAERELGPPDDVLACEHHSLLVYDRGIRCRENRLGTYDCALDSDSR